MSEHPVWFVGNRNPSITDVITDGDGVVVNLTGLSVKFKMREIGASTTTTDQPVSNTPGSDGVVRYDWQAADVDTAGTYLVWWEVTSGGKTQDLNEAIIRILAHAPITQAYVEREEFKSTASLTGFGFADADIDTAIVAASRGIDEYCSRRFYPDADATQVRIYTPLYTDHVRIDDLITLTSLKLDTAGLGSYGTTWTVGTHFRLEPLNALDDGIPYTTIRTYGANRLTGYPGSIEVTGKFGWSAAPAMVKQACTIIATRLLLRARQAPFGVVSIGLEGAAVRAVSMARDPELAFLLNPYAFDRVLV